MKTINKVLLTSAVVIIPLGIFAQEKFEKNENDNKHLSEYYQDSDDRKGSFNQYLIEKGVNYKFEGKLENKPKNELNGIWTIDGIKVIVNDKTIIKQSKKVIKIGDEIEIKAKRVNNKITAIILEQEDGFFK